MDTIESSYIKKIKEANEMEKISESTQLIPMAVQPIISPTEAKATIHQFRELLEAMLEPDDYQEFTSRGKKHSFPKKSGFRKLAFAFNLSDEILEERFEKREDGTGVWHFTVKAIAPNGRYSVGVGSFSTDEREVSHAEHDPRAMAHTRAKNRAISDLIAGGMLSAEEIIGTEYKPIPPKGTETTTSKTQDSELKKMRQQLHLKWDELSKLDPSVGDKKS
jgi:hypothetical protein